MAADEKVNILLVDDLPAKLLSYEVILQDLGENLLRANSARAALGLLLQHEIAVVLVDVCMPDLDGFELAKMIREHPRFTKTAIIFISAIQVTEVDTLRGYETGGVDYVPVPVVPAVLRAKVKVFVDLYRTTRELERLNRELEKRVEERTAELAANHAQLVQSEKRRTLSLMAGGMGSWDWDLSQGTCRWDEGQYRIYGEDPASFQPTPENMGRNVHPEDRGRWQAAMAAVLAEGQICPLELRIVLPDGQVRWCMAAAATTGSAGGEPVHVSGVTVDITDRKLAEERQLLLAREVDHRARNALAVAQSIVHLSRGADIDSFTELVNGRIQALARVHTLISESHWRGADLRRVVEDELLPYMGEAHEVSVAGPPLFLPPSVSQALALVVHELLTNAAKYGSLSRPGGQLRLSWQVDGQSLAIAWVERGHHAVRRPTASGFGSRLIRATIEGTLKGNVQLDWQPQGLVCRIVVPATWQTVEHAMERTAAPGEAPADPAASQRRLRVLLVEDESLIALMIEEAVVKMGHTVVGPLGDFDSALAAAKGAEFDLALLDVNLGGRLIFGVADALRDRGIPYLLLTGYGSESIPPDYRGAPALQKPIEPDLLRKCIAAVMPATHAVVSAMASRPPSAASQILLHD
ncbi:response regulator [Desertibaculum subflavum]|uniref:response regulator n=1 Tax=Desertibaculum subflavum TaxID=2268458 RepID=UPI000E65F91B